VGINTSASQVDRLAAANAAGIQHVTDLRSRHGETMEGLDPLSAADEAELVSFYVQQLSKLTASAGRRVPPHVSATAITYLRRFYLDHSCMEHDPLRIASTCLYIAGKVRA
jgi:Cyclin, N-terminal domain